MNELIHNNDWGRYANLAAFRYPAESVLCADSENTSIPFHCGDGCGWTVRWIAFPAGPPPASAGWPDPNRDYLDWTLHNGGSNLGFVDGHVKWYSYRNIRRLARGGTLRGHGDDDM